MQLPSSFLTPPFPLTPPPSSPLPHLPMTNLFNATFSPKYGTEPSRRKGDFILERSLGEIALRQSSIDSGPGNKNGGKSIQLSPQKKPNAAGRSSAAARDLKSRRRRGEDQRGLQYQRGGEHRSTETSLSFHLVAPGVREKKSSKSNLPKYTRDLYGTVTVSRWL